MQPSKFLILGGTGFVGTAITQRLAREGHSVLLPSRSPQRHPDLAVLPRIRLTAADIHDPATLNRLAAGVDVVVNLVGILNEGGHQGAGFRHAHTQLAEKVLAACRSNGVRRLLHMSSLRAQPDAPSHYLRSKGAAEQLIMESPTDLAWTIFRPSVIFGRHDSLTNRFADLLTVLPALPLARAGARFAPVHVADVVEAMVRSLDLPASHRAIYELGGPQIVTLGELVKYVAAVTHKRRWIFGIPDWTGYCQALVFEYLPGKVLSIDNFRSLELDSVPQTDGFTHLGIHPASMAAVVPRYLGRP
jgi:NADH dehydrogenase